MNVSAKLHSLIIGIGNPLRSDDGLGWAVAEDLSQASDLSCDIRTVYQLTPELAQLMATVDLVVMIDASHEGEPGELYVRPLSPFTPTAQPSAVGTHYTTPEELAALTALIYGHCPTVVVVSLTGEDFSLGEKLSSVVALKIPLVSDAVRRVYHQYL